MQNPYVKYLKTKNGYFYLFYYEHGNIFNRDPRRERKLLLHKREILRLFGKVQQEANMKLSPICSIPAAKGSFIWHPLPILPAGSTAPCEMAPPPPTVQGFSFCQARRPSILFTTCQQKQPAWIPLFTASFAMGNGKSPIRLTASCR